MRGGIGFAAVLAVAIWLMIKASRLRNEPSLRSGVSFYLFCMGLLVIGSLTLLYEWHRLISAGESFQPPTSALYAMELVGVIAVAIASAAVMGCLLGPISRGSERTDEFRQDCVPDSVRHFVPLAGYYLILFVVEVIGYLPGLVSMAVGKQLRPMSGSILLVEDVSAVIRLILTPLLMYGPFEVICRGRGAWQAILGSLSIWRSTAWGGVRLFAVGAFLYVLLSAPFSVADALVMSSMPGYIINSALASIVVVFVHVLTVLAVWEFYSVNIRDRELASDTV